MYSGRKEDDKLETEAINQYRKVTSGLKGKSDHRE